MGIGNRLFLWIGVSLAVAFGCLAYLIIPFIQQGVEQKTAETMSLETENAALKMDHWFSERGQILKSIAMQMELDSLTVDHPRLGSYLNSMAGRFGDKFSYLYVGFANKVHVTTRDSKPPADFDPTSRLWYRDAMRQNDVIVTEPYSDIITGRLSVTLAFPVKTAVPGVVGTDLYLGDLEYLTNKALFHPQAEAILISKAGTILYSTDKGFGSPGDAIAKIQNGLFEKLFALAIGEKRGAVRLERNGIPYQVHFSSVPSADWVIAVALPEAVFHKEEKNVFAYIVMALLFVITVIFTVIYFAIYQITTPLQWIAETAQKLGDGNLTETFPNAGSTEVIQLSQSLDKMRRNLQYLLEEKDNLLEETKAQNSEIEELYGQTKELVQELKAIVDNAVDAIYIKGSDGRYLLTNTSAKQLLGLNGGWSEPAGQGKIQALPAGFTDQDAAVMGGKNVNLEATVLVGGELRTYDVIKVPLKNDRGEATAICGIARDVTERKMTEKLQNALYRISETASFSDNLDNLYRSVHDIIAELIPTKNFYIAIHDEAKGMLHFPYRVDECDGNPGSRKFANGLPEYLIRTGQPLLIDPELRRELEERGEAMTSGTRATDWLGVPLKTGNNKIFGVMAVFSFSHSVRYTEEHQAILTFVSNQVAMAIERKQAEETSRYLGMHDALTGLYNRAYFEEELNRLRDDRFLPITVVMCDIDGLKLVNDTFGHAAGDQLLVATAKIIRRTIRQGDVAARIGGDEFAIILPCADERVAQSLAKRLRSQIEKYNRKAFGVPLSVSLGYAIRQNQASSMMDLLKEADNHMYREKLHHSQSARSAIVMTVMKLLEERDFITEEHAERLQDLTSKIAQNLKLPELRIAEIRLLAKFHDIGKVGIPDHILLKPGPLTDEEKIQMQRHCEIGYRIAQSSADLLPIADWILKHQEWWDGTGYPLGLEGGEIPLECRILAIADAYDAMTSDRPYRKALGHEIALRELERCAGTQFDPELVKVFVDNI
jgi:diguanylate cyclase (GGDEF)-like protein/PAS domain S-box-containing protein